MTSHNQNFPKRVLDLKQGTLLLSFFCFILKLIGRLDVVSSTIFLCDKVNLKMSSRPVAKTSFYITYIDSESISSKLVIDNVLHHMAKIKLTKRMTYLFDEYQSQP